MCLETVESFFAVLNHQPKLMLHPASRILTRVTKNMAFKPVFLECRIIDLITRTFHIPHSQGYIPGRVLRIIPSR